MQKNTSAMDVMADCTTRPEKNAPALLATLAHYAHLAPYPANAPEPGEWGLQHSAEDVTEVFLCFTSPRD